MRLPFINNVNVSSAIPPELLAWHLYCPWSYFVTLLKTNVSLYTTPVDLWALRHVITGVGYPRALQFKVTVFVRFTVITVLFEGMIDGGSRIKHYSCKLWGKVYIQTLIRQPINCKISDLGK